LDKGIKDVQDTVAAPDLRVFPYQHSFFVGLVFKAIAVVAEGLELEDEFVDDVPKPLVR
jgi:hypothetical protein